MRSMDIKGYVKHPLMALIVVLEYVVRTKSKEASRAANSGGSRRDIHQQVKSLVYYYSAHPIASSSSSSCHL